MKLKSVLLPTQFRRAWWSYAKLSNMCLFASISSWKPEGFASRGCCASSALNPQGPPSPCMSVALPAPLLAKRIFHSQIRGRVCQETPKEESGMLGAARQEADSQFLAPARQCPALVGMARPHKRVLAKYQDPFFPSQGLKLILCMVPSPHISPTAAACQCGAWTEATLPCCWPPKYLLALLHCFAVVFPSVPNYNKTTY